MGRSVETIGKNVIYFVSADIEPDWGWDDLCENITYALQSRYPSLLSPSRKWAGHLYHQENKILLENDHIQISIAEYCGCGAVSIFVRDDTEYPELAEHWLTQVWNKLSTIINQYVDTIHRVGTMSNGVGVFRK